MCVMKELPSFDIATPALYHIAPPIFVDRMTVFSGANSIGARLGLIQ